MSKRYEEIGEKLSFTVDSDLIYSNISNVLEFVVTSEILKFNDLNNDLNFLVRKINYEYSFIETDLQTIDYLSTDNSDLIYSNISNILEFVVTSKSLKFNDLPVELNFTVKKILYKYNSYIEDGVPDLNVTDLQTIDYLSSIDSTIIFANESKVLSFVIRDYDGVFILYKVLMDFIEDYSVGDVFLVSHIVDTMVDIYSGN